MKFSLWNSGTFILYYNSQVDLNQPMSEQLKMLSKYPIRTRLSLSGTLVVGRDIAHAKLLDRLNSGEGLPQYVKDHPIYYAGPAKKPEVIKAEQLNKIYNI